MFPTNEVIFTTVVTNSYLPRAMTMAKSVKKHMPGSKVLICLVEEKIPKAVKNLNNYFGEILLAKNIGIPQFYRCIFQYNQSGAANACKAQLMIHLLNAVQNRKYLVFLDADTKVFGPLGELTECMETSEIVFSPHFVSFRGKHPLQHLSVIHKSGLFNTGLFAIKRGKESCRFLRWWANLLLKYCYKDPQKGLWNEQKWLDLAPGLFQFQTQQDPGYNVGPWNFQERHLTVDENGKYLVNRKPLRLFHFSGLSGSYFTDNMARADREQKRIIGNLRKEYLHELEKMEQNLLSEQSWSYDFFANGSPIDKQSRLIFRDNPLLFASIDNPFLKNNRLFKLALEQKKKRR